MKVFNSIIVSLLSIVLSDTIIPGDCDLVRPPSINDFHQLNPATTNNTINPNTYNFNDFGGGYLGWLNQNNPYYWGIGMNPMSGYENWLLSNFNTSGSFSNDSTFGGSSGSNVYSASGSNLYSASGSFYLGGASGSLAWLGAASGSNFMGAGSGVNMYGGGSVSNYLFGGSSANWLAGGSGSNPFGGASGNTVGSAVGCAKQTDSPKASNRSAADNRARQLRYYGGAVMTTAKVFPIYWGSNYDMVNDSMDMYYRTILSSNWFDLLVQYSIVNNEKGRIYNGQFIGSYRQLEDKTYIGYNNTPTIDDKQIQDTLMNLLDTNQIPFPDHNTYYPVHLALGINFTIAATNTSACYKICAFHSRFFDEHWNENVFYGVIVDSGTCKPGVCGSKTATRISNNQLAASHEMMESITDPFIGYGWFDYSALQELGDMCNQEGVSVTGMTGLTVTATKIFNNGQIDDGCATYGLISPPGTRYSLLTGAGLMPPYNPSFEGGIKGWAILSGNASVTTSGPVQARDGIRMLKISNLSSVASQGISVTPGNRYKVVFYTAGGFNVTLEILQNLTWYNNINQTFGYDLIATTPEFNATFPTTAWTKWYYYFMAFDTSVQLKFSNFNTNNSAYLDTLFVEPYERVTGCNIYSNDLCTNPPELLNADFEDAVSGVGIVPNWKYSQFDNKTSWTAKSNPQPLVVVGRTSKVYSGYNAVTLGTCTIKAKNWARLSSPSLTVTPNTLNQLTFFGSRGVCINYPSETLKVFITDSSNATNVITTSRVSPIQNIQNFVTFLAPASGKIVINFETENGLAFEIDYVQVKQFSKDKITYANGVLFQGNN